MSKEEKIVFCTGGGCTAKLGAGVLSRILEKLPRGEKDPNLLVGPRLHMSRCSCRSAISCLWLQAFLHWGNHWKKDASGQNWHSRFCVSREMLC